MQAPVIFAIANWPPSPYLESPKAGFAELLQAAWSVPEEMPHPLQSLWLPHRCSFLTVSLDLGLRTTCYEKDIARQ
jgi:hypothetical protein